MVSNCFPLDRKFAALVAGNGWKPIKVAPRTGLQVHHSISPRNDRGAAATQPRRSHGAATAQPWRAGTAPTALEVPANKAAAR